MGLSMSQRQAVTKGKARADRARTGVILDELHETHAGAVCGLLGPGDHVEHPWRVHAVYDEVHQAGPGHLLAPAPGSVARLGDGVLATTDSIYAHMYPSDYASHVDCFEAFVAEAR